MARSEIRTPNDLMVWEMRQRQVDAALVPLDRVAREFEGKWGTAVCSRLPLQS